MSAIRLLPEYLINQIAAGEVVERPASVVKELIENSLDAGAKRLIIEIGNGGDVYIRVTDDGEGMDREDAVMAFGRHATSKITDTEDLFRIQTLGFRGEAIASIASVAHVKLQTKKKGELEGTIVQYEGGVRKGVKTAGLPEGTQIEVRNLFYNTPARKKYLKTTGTEIGHIIETVCTIALAYPSIGFKLIRDKKVLFDFPSSEELLPRIRAVLGKDISENVVPVFYGHQEIHLEGFIGTPAIARSSRKDQYLFVNGRPIKSNSLSYAVKQSYYSLLPKEKQPVFLLFLTVAPELVDVNVHPRKLEVRFKEEKELFRIITQACQKTLEKHVLAPKMESGEEAAFLTYQHGRIHKKPYRLEDSNSLGMVIQSSEKQYSIEQAMTFNQTISIPRKSGIKSEADSLPFNENTTSLAFEAPTATLERTLTGELVPLAQLDNAYILCQHLLVAGGHAGLSTGGLIIVDQHAAHERIRYTELVADFEEQKKLRQPLLVPLHVELSFQEMALLEEHLEFMNELGFEIEPFGGKTFSVIAVPSYMVTHDIDVALRGLLDDLSEGVKKGDFQKRKERALTYMACRSAVKFGDPLTHQEQLALVKKLQTIPLAYTCPHGRPTMITLRFEELLKRFGR